MFTASSAIDGAHQALCCAWNFQNAEGFMAGHIVLTYLCWEAGEDRSEQWEEISKPTQYNREGLFRRAPAVSLNYGWIWLATCAFPRGVFHVAANPLSALLSPPSSLLCCLGFSMSFWFFHSFSSNSFSHFSPCPSQGGTAGSQLRSLVGKLKPGWSLVPWII